MIRAHYKRMSEFERDHSIVSKKVGLTNLTITRQLGQRDAVIRLVRLGRQ